MAPSTEARKAELIEQAVQACSRLPAEEAALAADFVRVLYAGVAPEDLAERSPADLYGAALALLRLARRRSAGSPTVRVYNPGLEAHGWQSTHTCVELVNDDMPFLVDSVTMELNRHGITVHLIVHPVAAVCRDAGGTLTAIARNGEGPAQAQPESLMHLEVDRQPDDETLQALRQDLLRVLGDVRRAVEDWAPMRERLHEAIAEIEADPPPLDAQDVAEAVALLKWLGDRHFTFLGYRCWRLERRGGEDQLVSVPGSGLGITRDTGAEEVSRSFAALPPALRRLAREKKLLILTKSNSRATVHRPVYMDYVGVRRFGRDGEVTGEHRFLGLYTSSVYWQDPRSIPIVGRRIDAVLQRAGYPPSSHLGKALLDILLNYPRDELFQTVGKELYPIAMGIAHLQERQRLRLFVREDLFRRFRSCLVFVPRDRYNTELRNRFEAILMEALGGSSVEFNVRLTESPLARVHFIVHTDPAQPREVDVAAVEARLAQAMRAWSDDLHDALVAELGEEHGVRLFRRYERAFPAAYRDDFAARAAVYDIERAERCLAGGTLEMSLYRPPESPPGTLRFKLFQRERAINLSDVLPLLEDMGVRVLDEHPYPVRPQGAGATVWIGDFGLAWSGGELAPEAVREPFQETFLKAWTGEAESDAFNRLVLAAALRWRQVMVLRAYARYLRQAGTTFSLSYMAQALAAHPGITRALAELFAARFDPRRAEDAARLAARSAAVEQALEEVASLDEDRILRRYLAAINATLRTNFFQRDGDGADKPYLALKLDSAQVPELPLPRPMFEIYVYSPRTEGIHLRGGKVARGGLRWSDRREDFRSEVLGLMKAQMVKNAVIVPVGAKGGFVVSRPPAEREALMAEVQACYRIFIRGLLDLTDNLAADGSVVPPPEVVRRDGDDPYLVVAADKGTASFSDIANAIAAEYGFWLGDAFASGGSNGYDHKKMGITARGAWESVKRHFRELGVDVQRQDFTAVGIGDMSGDVFGNGMLLSRHIRLVAAFDHRHVFIDPDPDPETGFRERQRLFALPGSSWADYDPALISAGGGVWPRSAKRVQLSPQARRALGTDAEFLTPAELVRAVLRAPVDLLFNGGIGTYVKASGETHAEVGDRGNDAVRVDARDLRCRVVGEGGNLGFTQRARVEFARAGGRICTDAIDNSAGVNCSDHEVNIKILLAAVVAAGDLTEKQRRELLLAMTEDVARLVLRQNYAQAQALAVGRSRAPLLLDAQWRFMRALERAGRLDRSVESLPDDEELAARKGAREGLTVPEQAVLLAYAKLELYRQLLDSALPDDPWFGAELARYFPPVLGERFPQAMAQHRLRREIVATFVTNNLVNRGGITFVHRLQEEAGATAEEVARCYTMAREAFALEELWGEIEALDNIAPDAAQTRMLVEVGRLAVRGTLWFLRQRRRELDVAANVERYAPRVAELAGCLDASLGEAQRAALAHAAEALAAPGVPAALARRVAALDWLYGALDIAEVARRTGFDVAAVAPPFFAIGDLLRLPWLREQVGRLPAENHWQELARAAMRDDLAERQRDLTAVALLGHPDIASAAARLEAWQADLAPTLDRYRAALADLEAAGALDSAMLSVALRHLRDLA